MDLNPEKGIETLSITSNRWLKSQRGLTYDAQVICYGRTYRCLPDEEVDSLFRVLEDLKKRGKAIIYISHRLKEIFQICDMVTVMRDGEFIGGEVGK